MKDTGLTDSYIQTNIDSLNVTLNISLSEVKELKNSQYLLIIQSSTQKCVKTIIYPLNKEKIIKISLSGKNVSDEVLEDLSKLLQNYEIIHTSGLLVKRKHIFYECYLNLRLTDSKSKDLKVSLDKIRNIFKEIKIVEIGIKPIERE